MSEVLDYLCSARLALSDAERKLREAAALLGQPLRSLSATVHAIEQVRRAIDKRIAEEAGEKPPVPGPTSRPGEGTPTAFGNRTGD